MYFHDEMATPWGRLDLTVDAKGALVHIAFLDEDSRPSALAWLRVSEADRTRDARRVAAVTAELEAYLGGARQSFSLALEPRGTPFQQAVWKALLAITPGTTRIYGDIARELGRPNGARAVGRAVGSNPIPIIIPCHRVIGANGSLTGFAGGLAMKRGLLELEGYRDHGQLFSVA